MGLGWGLRARPVAPQQASRASSMTTLGPPPGLPPSPLSGFASPSERVRRWCATLVPVMPEPMITTSAVVGRSLVERWPVRRAEGSECQKEFVECSGGGSQGFLFRGMEGRLEDMFCYEVSRKVRCVELNWIGCEDKKRRNWPL